MIILPLLIIKWRHEGKPSFRPAEIPHKSSRQCCAHYWRPHSRRTPGHPRPVLSSFCSSTRSACPAQRILHSCGVLTPQLSRCLIKGPESCKHTISYIIITIGVAQRRKYNCLAGRRLAGQRLRMWYSHQLTAAEGSAQSAHLQVIVSARKAGQRLLHVAQLELFVVLPRPPKRDNKRRLGCRKEQYLASERKITDNVERPCTGTTSNCVPTAWCKSTRYLVYTSWMH